MGDFLPILLRIISDSKELLCRDVAAGVSRVIKHLTVLSVSLTSWNTNIVSINNLCNRSMGWLVHWLVAFNPFRDSVSLPFELRSRHCWCPSSSDPLHTNPFHNHWPDFQLPAHVTLARGSPEFGTLCPCLSQAGVPEILCSFNDSPETMIVGG